MRFCLINNLYPPIDRGGAERIVELIAEELKKRGEVLVITSQPDWLLDRQKIGDFEICRLNPLNIYHLLEANKQTARRKLLWHFNDLFKRPVLHQVGKILSEKPVDFVFTHNLKGLSLGIPKIIRKLKLTQIHTLHDYQLLDPHGSLHRQGQNLALKHGFYPLYRYFTRQAIKSPSLVVSPSKFVLDKHLEYGFFKKSKTVVLPNPVELSGAELQLPKVVSDKLRILYLGQIEPHKGVKFLVDSFVKWNNANAELTIAGEGSELQKINESMNQKINESARSRIKILGKVAREKLPELFAAADLLVVPSMWWENSPTVIYEAYGYQVPVLVANTGGAPELVKNGTTGFIFTADNQEDLIDKLNAALKQKDKLPELGKQGYEFIKHFEVKNYVDKLLELCQTLKK
ncbi:MAG: glycosyltransferase family 4 protein [Candidatus Komeilibacteria bacterium]|nr:glycosyltransferase family 4 protein [Candidatus Komeilibacteria bacterium]